MESRKVRFIEDYRSARGIICEACRRSGVPRTTFYRWKSNDAEFRQACDDIIEEQIDSVEGALLQKIDKGDTIATIFYLKTRGKSRGWTERDPHTDQPKDEPVQPQVPVALPARKPKPKKGKGKKTAAPLSDFDRKVKSRRDYFVRLLKKEGKYTAELSMQVTIAARLTLRIDELEEEMKRPDYSPVNVEISREGNRRLSVNPIEQLYKDYTERCSMALRACGMNFDSKDRKTGNDGFSDFMAKFNDEE